MASCSNPDCGKPTWNGQAGHCSLKCQSDTPERGAACGNPACSKTSWNGQPGYCSMECSDASRPAEPPQVAAVAVSLLPQLHPSMGLMPFALPPVDLSSSDTVFSLTRRFEWEFMRASAADGAEKNLSVSVLWNTKDDAKALNPSDALGLHFQSGDSFGVYGDITDPRPPPVFMPEKDKLPVTILTGFLGSGKTTLLNYILQEQRDKKIAVIENEFGEISIDDELLKQDKLALAEKVVVMDNGCMCCTIRDDLVKGLQSILQEIKDGAVIDNICIETTGMADPVPIIRTFMSDPYLTESLRLDGVVAVADAKNLPGRLDDDIEEGKVNEAFQQIAFADKIILNKLDLISIEEAIACKDRIRSVNSFAKVLPAVRGRIDLTELANIRAHDMSNFVEVDIEKEAAQEGHGEGRAGHEAHGEGHGHGEDCEEGHGHGGGHGGGDGADAGYEAGGGHGIGHTAGHGAGHGGGGAGHGHASRHDKRVNSFAMVHEGEILPNKLRAWMTMLHEFPEGRGTIFRIKAILAIHGHPFKHVFHRVMDVSDENDAGPWEDDEKKVSKIVFIGKGLDRAFITEGWDDIFKE